MRAVRVFAADPRLGVGILLCPLRKNSGKAPFAVTIMEFTLFCNRSSRYGPGGSMYRKRISVLATILIASSAALSILSAPVTSAATKPKAAGRTTTIEPNTILNGKGAPLSSKGIDGDFYIDTRSLQIYGPKKSGKWPVPQSLQGPVGANGTDGKNGNEGKTISAASTVAGPTGTQGSQGLQGSQGEKGERGEGGSPGANGSSGPAGPAGATGPQGPSGGGGSVGPAGANGANGATGATGLTGAKGETGTVGSIGVTGLKGETGTVGATGPSNVFVNALPTWTLSTGTKRTFAVSPLTQKFIQGKSYFYTIYLYGVSDANAAVFSLEILHEDNSVANFNYSIGFANGLELDPKMYRYFFTITGTFTPASADSGISIKVIDDMGVTAGAAIAFSGRMYSTLVGSIGAL